MIRKPDSTFEDRVKSSIFIQRLEEMFLLLEFFFE